MTLSFFTLAENINISPLVTWSLQSWPKMLKDAMSWYPHFGYTNSALNPSIAFNYIRKKNYTGNSYFFDSISI